MSAVKVCFFSVQRVWLLLFLCCAWKVCKLQTLRMLLVDCMFNNLLPAYAKNLSCQIQRRCSKCVLLCICTCIWMTVWAYPYKDCLFSIWMFFLSLFLLLFFAYLCSSIYVWMCSLFEYEHSWFHGRSSM